MWIDYAELYIIVVIGSLEPSIAQVRIRIVSV
jgi:hypothetical protein